MEHMPVASWQGARTISCNFEKKFWPENFISKILNLQLKDCHFLWGSAIQNWTFEHL